MKKITILGSTGSIGIQALEVIEELNYDVVALSCGSNLDLLCEQAQKFHPRAVCLKNQGDAERFAEKYQGAMPEIFYSKDGLCEVASIEVDLVLNAISGFSGLYPTLAAINSKNDLALANKETLVAAGKMILDLAKEKGVSIRPVDSEHSAIWQCLQGEARESVSKVVLTASGGPFLGRKDLLGITPEDAVKHPNWSMGAKISVDSASLMNKALEVVEAAVLFELAPEEIEIIAHKESIIHSWVEFIDSSRKAQFSAPDMKIPIQLALTYPERKSYLAKTLDMSKLGTLSFQQVDLEVFPAAAFGHKALWMGGVTPAVMSAANEVAVELFLHRRMEFSDISRVVSNAMDNSLRIAHPSMEDLIEADRWAREFVLTEGVKY